MKNNRNQKKLNKKNLENQDPVEVFCRLKPPTSEDICCKYINYNKVLLFPPENITNIRNANNKECEYTFSKVFSPESKQRAVFQDVAKPLVRDLIEGKNGLVFAYGVTGSGKTYTMNGKGNDEGILIRCLDTIFNTLDKYQSEKYVFKPDRNNGFDILEPDEAAFERKKAMSSSSLNKIPVGTTPRKFMIPKEENYSNRSPDSTIIEDIPEDNAYCIFVSFIEIYNNYIYDLLEDVSLDQINMKTQISKTLREDSNHSVYVSGCTEVEVKSTDDAIEVLYKGLRKKRMACTALNAESSRSHSVFNIRLIQAPLDPYGEYVLRDKSKVCLSQLALVDLAGSERSNRTNNVGDRLREAGNINASLMVLRKCIEILRENQKDLTNAKIVPYRDSKLTHLFKNYFDGEGKVRMVVCINPDATDFEENLHVIRFAELTQEVQVSRPMAQRVDFITGGMTPGRRRANQIMKEAMKNAFEPDVAVHSDDEDMLENGNTCLSTPSVTPPPTFDLGPNLPNLDLIDINDSTMLLSLENILNQKRDKMMSFVQLTLANFDDAIKSNGSDGGDIDKLKKECKGYKVEILNLDRDNLVLQNRVKDLERMNSNLSKKMASYDKSHKTFENLLDENEMARRKMEKDMEKQIKAKEIEMENKLWAKNEKLRQLKKIVEENGSHRVLLVDEEYPKTLVMTSDAGDPDLYKKEIFSSDTLPKSYGDYKPAGICATASNDVGDGVTINLTKTPATPDFLSPTNGNSTIRYLLANTPKLTHSNKLPFSGINKNLPKTAPVAAKKHTLVVPSNSNPATTPCQKYGHVASVAKMYDNKIASLVKGTPVTHPRHRRRSRSVGDIKFLQHKPSYQMKTADVMQPKMRNVVTTDKLVKSSLCKADRYVLNTQKLDEMGDLKTELYKGGIFSTSGGGKSVIFDDMERHEHRSLTKSDYGTTNGAATKRSSSPTSGGGISYKLKKSDEKISTQN